jgi:[ribosomal protein S5]-alanine N-acetyltransferase
MKIPTLKTARLTLRPIKITDLDDLFILRSDECASNFIDAIIDIDKDQTFKQLISTLKDIEDGKYWKWAIDLDGLLIGTIALWNHNLTENSAEFGYRLRSPYRGKGYMSESLACLLNYGHHDLSIKNLYVYTEASNERSNRLMPKLGFVYINTIEEMGVVLKDTLFHYKVYCHTENE